MNLSGLVSYSLIGIVAGFMPIVVVSFFWFRVSKKQHDYDKVIQTFGIKKSKDVRDTYRLVNYLLPLLFLTVITTLAITICVDADVMFPSLMSNDKSTTDNILLAGSDFGSFNPAIQRQALVMVSYAFLGSFLWSAKEVIFRLLNNDLVPSIFYSAGLRIIIACSVVLVFYFFLGSDNSVLKNAYPWLAFFTGMIPDRIINFLVEKFKVFTNGKSINTEELSLDKIEGISLSHKERLEEEGIFNAQNLANASLTQLIIQTPYEPRQILDWIGQAKLLCYAKQDIDKLRSVGIRTVYDLFKGNKSKEALQELTEACGLNTPMLVVISEQVREDIGIRTLNNFMNRLNGDNTSIQYYSEKDIPTS